MAAVVTKSPRIFYCFAIDALNGIDVLSWLDGPFGSKSPFFAEEELVMIETVHPSEVFIESSRRKRPVIR